MDSEEQTSRCSYPLCENEEQKHKCKFCGEYFCDEHLKPKPPTMPVSTSSEEDRELMKEYWRPDGHPCEAYMAHWSEERKKEKARYTKALKNLQEGPAPTGTLNDYNPPEEPDKPQSGVKVSIPNLKTVKLANPSPKAKRTLYVLFAAAIILILLALCFIFMQKEPPRVYVPADCEDGTLSGECSENQPYICLDGVLEHRASLCGCPEGLGIKGEKCATKCKDGTLEGDCSVGKPLYCSRGSLIPKASVCDCPKNYVVRGDTCKENLTCADGTLYGECAPASPLYCERGVLINKSTLCNCPQEQVSVGEGCVSEYMLGSDERLLEYTLRGKTAGVRLTMYKGLNDHLSLLPRRYVCRPVCPSPEKIELIFIDHEKQRIELEKLVEEIRAITPVRDDQARIAVSLIQTIPYDRAGVEADNLSNRYPYQVLFEEKGVCGEKSRLLAFILRELGYGVVLLNYEKENHMAVGIRCPEEYSQYILNATPYCFIETSGVAIITNNNEEYAESGKLETIPEAYNISVGDSFDSVSEEYGDYQKLKSLIELSDASGGTLEPQDYDRWQTLIKKYNIPVQNQTEN